jgi:syntaxin-binding protein 1
VFVIGGTTYSEIRSAYEIGETYNRDVFIGSTEILRPNTFIEHLGHLQFPVPSLQSVIAPYVAPAPPQIQRNDSAMSKTASLMSHMHINSPTPLSNKSSSMSLDKMSTGSTTPEEHVEKKKKKKGLAARLFG